MNEQINRTDCNKELIEQMKKQIGQKSLKQRIDRTDE